MLGPAPAVKPHGARTGSCSGYFWCHSYTSSTQLRPFSHRRPPIQAEEALQLIHGSGSVGSKKETGLLLPGWIKAGPLVSGLVLLVGLLLSASVNSRKKKGPVVSETEMGLGLSEFVQLG